MFNFFVCLLAEHSSQKIVHFMIKVIKTIAIIFIYLNQAYAQIDAGDDIIICDIENVNLSADYTPNSIGTSDYSIEDIALDLDPLNT